MVDCVRCYDMRIGIPPFKAPKRKKAPADHITWSADASIEYYELGAIWVHLSHVLQEESVKSLDAFDYDTYSIQTLLKCSEQKK